MARARKTKKWERKKMWWKWLAVADLLSVAHVWESNTGWGRDKGKGVRLA